jgi:O-antigen ligase
MKTVPLLLGTIKRQGRDFAPAWLLFVFFMLGTGLLPNIGMMQYDIKRALFFFFLLVGFIYLSLAAKPHKVSIDNWASVFWFLFVLAQLVNAYFINDSLYSFLDVLLLMAISVAFIGYLGVNRRVPALKTYLLLALVYGLATYYLFVLLQYIFFLILPVPWTIHLLSWPAFVNVRFLNQLMVLIFPLVLFAQCFASTPRLLQWFLSFAAVMTIALLLNSNGRGAFIMILFESLLLLTLVRFTPYHSKTLRIRLVKVWLVGCLVFAVFFVWLPSLRLDVFQVSVIRYSDSSRLGIWREAFELWLNNKWWGHGGMSYADKSVGVSFHISHPHNSIVQILYEYGLIGLISLSVAVLVLLKKVVFHLINFPAHRLLVPVLVALLGGAGLSLVSGVIVMPFSQLTLFVLLLVVVSIVYEPAETTATEFRFPLTVSVSALMLVGSVVFCLLAGFSYLSWLHTMGQDVISFTVGPRFWLVGSLDI